jgi:hypothetical protein
LDLISVSRTHPAHTGLRLSAVEARDMLTSRM